MSDRDICLSKHLLFAAFASSIGPGFQHGFNAEVFNEIKNVTIEWIRRCGQDNSTECACTSEEAFQVWKWAVFVFFFGAISGAWMVNAMASSFGRKQALLMSNVFVFIAVTTMLGSKYMDSPAFLIVARLFMGVAAGLASGLTPIYLLEISPTFCKGAIAMFYPIITVIATVSAQVMGLHELLGSEYHWPILLSVTVIPVIIHLVLFPFCPESPSFLLLEKNNLRGCKKALAWLHEPLVAHEQMEDLESEKSSSEYPKERVSILRLLSSKSFRRPLIIALLLMLIQSLSSLNAVVFYADEIFISIGLAHDEAELLTLGLGVLRLATTLLALFLVDVAGRKPLLLGGLISMISSTIILYASLKTTTYGGFGESFDGLTDDTVVSTYLITGCVVVYVISSALGPGPIPWFMIAELFPHRIRPPASSVCLAINWIINLSIYWTVLTFRASIGPEILLFHLALLIIFATSTYFVVPETKNSSSTEISTFFN